MLPNLEPFEPHPEKRVRERCALGHRLSPYRRFRAIYGVPETSWMYYFDLDALLLHLMTIMLSQGSSRDLSIIWHIRHIPRVRRRFRASPRAIKGS